MRKKKQTRKSLMKKDVNWRKECYLSSSLNFALKVFLWTNVFLFLKWGEKNHKREEDESTRNKRDTHKMKRKKKSKRKSQHKENNFREKNEKIGRMFR